MGNSMLISGVKEILILVLGVMLILSRNSGKRFFVKRKYFGLITVYAILLVYAACRATSFSYIYIDSKYYLIWPLMIFITMALVEDYSDYKMILTHVNIICIVLALIGVFAYKSHNMLLTQWRTTFQVYAPKSLLSTTFDFGALMAIATFMNLVTIYYERLTIRRSALIVLYGCMTFLSYTRGSYLCLILVVYLMLRNYFVDKGAGRKWAGVIKFIVDILMLLVCLYILEHYSESNMLSSVSIIDRFNKVWPSLKIDSIFIGAGFGTVGRSVNGISMYGVSDNSFLRIMLTMGIVGLVMVVCIFYRIYKDAANKQILSVLYISVGVTAFVSDFIVFTPAALLVYCMIGVCMKLKQGEHAYKKTKKGKINLLKVNNDIKRQRTIYIDYKRDDNKNDRDKY